MTAGALPITGAAIADDSSPRARLASLARYLPETLCVLFEVDAYQEWASYLPGANPGTLNEWTLRWSDRGFAYNPGDGGAVVNLPAGHDMATWPGRIKELTLTRSVAVSPDASNDGGLSGEAVLDNGDRGLDWVPASCSVINRTCRIYLGPANGKLADFAEIFRGACLSWEGGQEVTIRFGDLSTRLDAPIQWWTYTGDGGIYGAAELRGKPRPLAYGRCLNVRPVLVDPVKLIYQVHERQVLAIDAVYDRGKALTPGADAADLWTGSTTWGSYRTCLAQGLFQLGSPPAGADPARNITADVRGDAVGGYVDTVPAIAARVSNRVTGGTPSVDVSALAGLTGEAGVYIQDEVSTTGRQVVDALLRGVGAHKFCLRSGVLRCLRFAAPDPAAAVASFTALDVIEIREIPLPDSVWPPPTTRRVGYARNWTVQTDADLITGITEVRRLVLKESYQTVTATDQNMAVRYQKRIEAPTVESHLIAETSANEVLTYLTGAFDVPRRMFEVTVRVATGVAVDVGDTIKATLPVYGMAAGAYFRAYPVREDLADRTVTFIWWG